MTKQEIYAEILTALSALKDTEAAEYWQKCAKTDNLTGKLIRKSILFSDDVATTLYNANNLRKLTFTLTRKSKKREEMMQKYLV